MGIIFLIQGAFMTDPKDSYIYVYTDPTKKGKFYYKSIPNISLLYEPFYIGKGRGYRMYNHIVNASRQKSLKDKKILEIKNKGFDVKSFVFKIYTNLSSDTAFNKEIEIIYDIGRKCINTGVLLNITIGGTGSRYGQAAKFCDSDKKDICNLYVQGFTLTEISNKYQTCISTIFLVIKENNITMRNSRTEIKKLYPTICNEYVSGSSSVTLSEKYGVDHKTITNILKKNGIQRRPVGRHKKSPT